MAMNDNIFAKIAQCPSAHEALSGLEEEARRKLEAAGRVYQMPSGTTLFRPGDLCENYLVMLRGAARITLTSEAGREILLYRVEPGQSCVLTTAALMAGDNYDAEGVTETDVEALVIPDGAFRELLAMSEAFRRFVFSSFAIRLQDLIALVGEVAFSRLDRRLGHFLLRRADGQAVVRMTHQEIASEVGSTREAVSRLLKSFEREGLVVLRRGVVELTDPQKLERLAGQE